MSDTDTMPRDPYFIDSRRRVRDIQAAMAEDERIASLGNAEGVQHMLVNWTYAFGYCMCRYLNKEHKEAFHEYIKADLNGDGGMDAFQRIFKIKDLSQFEKDLYEYYE